MTSPSPEDPLAPPHLHRYHAQLRWEGSTGQGYEHYTRAHDVITPPARTIVRLSSDPAFRGDATLMNPEQLLVAAASSCQLLSFLAVSARARIDVIAYEDHAEGVMSDGPMPMWIERIVLRPRVTVRVDVRAGTPGARDERVRRLLELAHRECYIASSLRTDVVLEPVLAWVGEAAVAGTDPSDHMDHPNALP